MIELVDTDSADIAAALLRARVRAGSPAMGMVMTLVIVVAEDDADRGDGRGPRCVSQSTRRGCSASSWATPRRRPGQRPGRHRLRMDRRDRR